ncbi:hypothetical protein LCGC14_1217510 [marine sediment metagenome]|uniref:Uncharacterized protein n=1 Tax=marine sediment metagenome TaxID=412755 RepID=A0A0F9PGS7_9ZZZZ
MKPLIILPLALLLSTCAFIDTPVPSPCARVTVLIEGVVVEDKPQTDEIIYQDAQIYSHEETISGVTRTIRAPFWFFPLLGHPDMGR